jgi:hypothetical protein
VFCKRRERRPLSRQTQTGKSFLVLFFKKEPLSFYPGKKASGSFLKKRTKKLLLVWRCVFGWRLRLVTQGYTAGA